MDHLRAVLRLAAGHAAEPGLAMIDSRTLCSTLWSERTGDDGGKRKKGSKLHMAVDTIPGRIVPLPSRSAAGNSHSFSFCKWPIALRNAHRDIRTKGGVVLLTVSNAP
ncbi:hypothetical protein FHS96_005884 [Sphingomonas zeicaulis]|uniref:hypothetical protein n=1 Tax=Sphingomonas zeicaulis TaxID=1632740 RepID=UPI003D1E084C